MFLQGRIMTTSSLSPVGAHSTKMHTVATIRKSPLFTIFRPLIEPVVLKIIKQDAQILSAQSQNQRAFGGEQYTFHSVDVLGSSIARLMKQATREALTLYDTERAVEQESRGSLRT